jgi:hypothetical protein
VATLAAAGGTSQATIATGCRQSGQAGAAVRVAGATGCGDAMGVVVAGVAAVATVPAG